MEGRGEAVTVMLMQPEAEVLSLGESEGLEVSVPDSQCVPLVVTDAEEV